MPRTLGPRPVILVTYGRHADELLAVRVGWALRKKMRGDSRVAFRRFRTGYDGWQHLKTPRRCLRRTMRELRGLRELLHPWAVVDVHSAIASLPHTTYWGSTDGYLYVDDVGRPPALGAFVRRGRIVRSWSVPSGRKYEVLRFSSDDDLATVPGYADVGIELFCERVSAAQATDDVAAFVERILRWHQKSIYIGSNTLLSR